MESNPEKKFLMQAQQHKHTYHCILHIFNEMKWQHIAGAKHASNTVVNIY